MALRAFRELVSPITQFVESCIEIDVRGSGVPADYLYVLWKWWCAREGRNPGLKGTFLRNLLSAMTGAMQIRVGEVGNAEHAVMGIRVTEWAEKENMKGV